MELYDLRLASLLFAKRVGGAISYESALVTRSSIHQWPNFRRGSLTELAV